MLRSLILLSALAGASLFAPAHAEITNCTNITSLPAVISTQGVYCLKQDLSTTITSGAAITINTNNVTLDCNDWKIGGLAAGIGTNAVGISAAGRLNLTVRHCGVRGFKTGIAFTGASGAGHLIEDNRVDLNTYIGIQTEGDGNVIRRNRVVDTGGAPNFSQSNGIVATDIGAVITGNLVSGVTVTGSSGNGNVNGINLYGSNQEVDGNIVTGLVPVGSGLARGIYGAGWAAYRDNSISSSVGTTNGFGISFTTATSLCAGNVVHGYSTGLTGCADGGGNLSN